MEERGWKGRGEGAGENPPTRTTIQHYELIHMRTCNKN